MRFIEKPWGYEKIWAETSHYVGKLIHIKQGFRLSMQYHVQKDETILISKGKMLLVVGDQIEQLQEVIMNEGDTYHILPGQIHRMVALETCELIEVSTTELLDVVRLDDDFGREGTSAP